MAGRSTRRQVALGETPPVGSFDRGWGHLKVCSPAPCPLFFSLPLVLLSFLFSKARTHAPLTVEAEGTTAEGPEVALFLCPCPFFVLVSLFLSPFRPRPRYLFACLLPFFQPPFTRHSSFCCPLFILSLSHTPFFLFVYLSVKHASPPPCRDRSYNRGRPKGCPPSLPLPIICSLLPYC